MRQLGRSRNFLGGENGRSTAEFMGSPEATGSTEQTQAGLASHLIWRCRDGEKQAPGPLLLFHRNKQNLIPYITTTRAINHLYHFSNLSWNYAFILLSVCVCNIGDGTRFLYMLDNWSTTELQPQSFYPILSYPFFPNLVGFQWRIAKAEHS